MNVEERIKKLRETIRHHRHLYHVEDRSEISPEALDSLKKDLFDLESEHPELITPDSPTQRVAGEPLDEFEKVEHIAPMYSIDDAFSRKDMEGWEKRNRGVLRRNIGGYCCEVKFDGVAVELVYRDHVLEVASTRGDGEVGEDVTHNIRTSESVPLRVKEADLVVRGEVVIPLKEFERINREENYANPRNLVAGSVRQLDPKVVADRGLEFFAFALVTDLGQKTHREGLDLLKELGFKISPSVRECPDLDCVFDFFEEIEERRDNLSFEIDGVVVNVNQKSQFDSLGATGKSPRGIVALKFPLKKATTVLKRVDVQVGRTGVLTPVAILEPVEVGGVTISRATLHNWDEIQRLGVRMGDTVVVGRAGDVIPRVLGVLERMRSGDEKEVGVPKQCPICDSSVEKKQEGVDYYCSNPDCFARQKRQLTHLVSRGGFNIEGLGPKILDKFFEEGLIGSSVDIFSLKKGDIIPLEGFGERAASNIVREIEESKKITLDRFLYSLGIKGVGEETAYSLSRRFSLEEIIDASQAELEAVEDIGEVVASNIKSWFRENQELVDGLLEAGVRIKEVERGGLLKGKRIVFTGSLEISRLEAKKRVKELGGRPSNSVSQETDMLVVGNSPGSKFERAKELGVRVVGSDEFMEMI